MKVLRTILVVLASMLLVLVTTATLILVQPDWFKTPINRLVADQTGFDLRFDSLTTGLQPTRFEATGISLAYGGNTLLTTERMTLTLSDWPSLSAPFFTLQLNRPTIDYRLDEQGRSNWPQSDAPAPPPAEPAALVLPADFAFYALAIADGTAHIQLPGQARDIRISQLNLERTAPEVAQLTLQTTISEQTFQLDGEFVLQSENQLTLDLGLKHAQLETLLQATLSTRRDFEGSRGSLNLNLENTAFLSALLGTRLPDLPRTTLHADFAIGAHYQLDKMALQLGDQQLTGTATFSPQDRHLNASLHSPALDIDQLQALLQDTEALADSAEELEQAVTEPGPRPEAAIDWSALTGLALDLEVKVDDLQAQGMTTQQLESHLVLRNAGETPKIALALSSSALRYQQHQIDSLALNAEIEALALQTQGADASLSLTAKLDDTVNLKASGQANLNGLGGQNLELAVDSPNSAALWKIAALPYREAGALSIKGTLSSDDNSLTPDLAIALGEQQLDIEARYRDGDRPHLNLIANGRNLDLRFTQAEAATAAPQQEQEQEQEQEQATPDSDSPLFSRDPIDTEVLRQMDADISLDIKKLRTAVNQIDELAIIARLKDGRLTTRNSRVTLPDGSVDLSLDGQFAEQGSKLRTELKMDSQNIGGLGLEQAAQIRQGHGKVDLKLSTEGRSPHELASALKGHIDVKAQDMIMNNNKVNLIGSDIVSELIGKLNPFAKSDPTTQLECVSLYFDVDKGVLTSDRSLHVETRKMKIIGKGEIDLNKEQLSMNFTPIARKGLGVNLSHVVKLVKLHGPISSPGIGVDAGGLLTSALSTGAAMATGGASLVAQSLIERTANSGSACDPSKKLELDLPPESAAPADGAPAAQE